LWCRFKWQVKKCHRLKLSTEASNWENRKDYCYGIWERENARLSYSSAVVYDEVPQLCLADRYCGVWCSIRGLMLPTKKNSEDKHPSRWKTTHRAPARLRVRWAYHSPLQDFFWIFSDVIVTAKRFCLLRVCCSINSWTGTRLWIHAGGPLKMIPQLIAHSPD